MFLEALILLDIMLQTQCLHVGFIITNNIETSTFSKLYQVISCKKVFLVKILHFFLYTDVLCNAFKNVGCVTTSSFLFKSEVTNMRGVLIIPFLSTSINGSVASCNYQWCYYSQLQSPFDTTPATSGLFSLTNIQVTIGAVNQLNNVLNYGFENFIQRVSLYKK